MRTPLLTTAIWAVLATPAAALASAADATDAHDMDTVVVSGTRTERAPEDVPATVTAIDRERLDRELVFDLKDLFRYEPGLSVGGAFGRFGVADIRIRGLGGNRVRIETDGIAVSDGYAIGSFSNANRDFVDLDTLKRVEVVRGPASSLYGSDALGGVVAFVTKDPADYLAPGKDAHFGVKLGFESDWDGLFGGATAAWRRGRWSWLLAGSHRQGQQTESQGERDVDGELRTAPNPQDRAARSVLAKAVYEPDAAQRWRFTVEGSEARARTDIRSQLGYQPRTRATVGAMHGDDLQHRARVSVAYEHDALDWTLADRVHALAYRQDSQTTQHTDEVQLSAARVPTRRQRLFDFDQRVTGAELIAYRELGDAPGRHTLTWGLDLAQTEIAQKRDGVATRLDTGEQSNVIVPDVFPVRDFPLSRLRTVGLFVQDEVELLGGRMRLVPGLRVDHFRLTPRADAIHREDNPDMVLAAVEETSVAPKLGAVWRLVGDWSLFGSYARGFRSPPYNDVNLGFTNWQHGYASIPNPDLKPETSDGFEVGLRHAGPVWQASLVLFHNRYRDFIESGALVSAPPQTPLRIFQSRNVQRAVIEGAELKADLDVGQWREALLGWRLRGAVALQRGEDTVGDRPLASVDPLRATLGLAYDAADWGVELVGRGAARHGDAPAGQFVPPGHGVLDLLVHWQFAPGLRLDAGVFNLGDRTYWEWSDVTGVASGGAVVDRYTRPGRTLGLSLAASW